MMTRKSILVVDDDPNICEVLATNLKVKGYVVKCANTGKNAIEMSKDEHFNLALIDIRLPDMQGTELLTQLRGTIPKMMKIIITGYPSIDNAVEALNKGADAYIIKPLDIEKVLNTIEEKLKMQEVLGATLYI
jgi:DNA-binding NtrC family response regulator